MRLGMLLASVVWMLASCSEPPPPSCATDTDCAPGSFCDDSACRTVCEADLDCERMGLGTCDTARGRCLGLSADGGGLDGGVDAGRDASSSCDEDGDGQDSVACGGADCDDEDPEVFSGAVEVCSASDLSTVTRDENCDPSDRGVQRVGSLVSIDADGDGYASSVCCNADGETMLCGDDCDDVDAGVHPDLPDICGDLTDQDCDGRIDEGGVLYRDVDLDGRGDPAVSMVGACTVGWVFNADDCDDNSQTTFLGARERCDGIDNDCSLPGALAGGPDLAEDMDGDHHSPLGATCLDGTELGTGALGSEYDKNDCNDADATIYPGADEICGNGVDENCSGVPDDPSGTVYRDDDGDGHGTPGTSMAIMSCIVPDGWSRSSDDCDDARANRHGRAPEVCDRIDNDCSTPATLVALDEDADGDGHAPIGAMCLGLGDAMAPSTAFPRDDCADDDATTRPGAVEYCDGQDRDCSSGGGVALDEDADGDGHSPIDAMCIGRGEPGAPGSSYAKDDCDDARATVHGGRSAIDDTSSCDGLDNDCSALTTELGLVCPTGGYCNPGATCGRTLQVAELGAGGGHTCARHGDGTVRCWGWNRRGQLGDGTLTDRTSPTTVPALSGVLELGRGGEHTCARIGDGTVRCWGDNFRGQLGDGTTTTSPNPRTVSDLSSVVELSAGGSHTCVRIGDGRVRCWGYNLSGQLGDGTTTTRVSPRTVSDLSGVVELSAGGSHTCARLEDGTVRCWGRNVDGELGDGTTTSSTSPRTVSGLSGVVELSAGGSHTCARLGDGTVRCWGRNVYGELGDGTTTSSPSPRTVSVLSGVVELSAGGFHTCARLEYGTVRCWGGNVYGQIGDGTTTNRVSGSSVLTLSVEVMEMTAGDQHTCALLADGNVRCWGLNSYGQLGDGTATNRSSPTLLPALSGVVELAAGTNHTCGRLGDGTVRCWGSNDFGGLGDGTTTNRSSPTPVTGLTGVVELTAGYLHTCARLGDGTVRCWGSNDTGQLGDGTTTNRSIPTPVTGLIGVVELTAGSRHTCARLGDGTVRCWGYNFLGQLGDGTRTNRTSPIAPVPSLIGVVELSAGGSHTCVRVGDGTVRCWGHNDSGQLGDGTRTNRSSPTLVTGLIGVVELRAGGIHTCARLGDGSARCWGSNYRGQLGDGTTTDVRSPIAVPGLSGVLELSAGGVHTCARLGDGSVRCWGSNFNGQLGDWTNTNRLTPTLVWDF